MECEYSFLPWDLANVRLEKGDVQWMTAGKGIMHSEMPIFDEDDVGKSEGLQLWVDLPKAQKYCEPSYQERKAKE